MHRQNHDGAQQDEQYVGTGLEGFQGLSSLAMTPGDRGERGSRR
jgi:hypothetical protein